jgi:hypothetical protein
MASAGLNLPQVEIAGVGMHPFGRYSDRSLMPAWV